MPPQAAPGGPVQLGTPGVRPRPLGANPPPQLLERAASKVADFTVFDRQALAEGHLALASLLLGSGADANAKNRFGRTAAEQAAAGPAGGRGAEGEGEGAEAAARAPPQRRERRVVISSGLVI